MLKAHREETGKRRELWSSRHASATRHLEALTPSTSPATLVHGPLCIFSLSEPPALNSPVCGQESQVWLSVAAPSAAQYFRQ